MARPRKKDRPRYEGGRIIPLTPRQVEEQTKSVVVGQRIKFCGAPSVEAAVDPDFESILGLLKRLGILNQHQKDAGEEFARRWAAWARWKVEPRRFVGSPSDLNRSGGEDCSPDPEDERVDKVAVQYREMVSKLVDLERQDRLNAAWTGERIIMGALELMERVCVENREMAVTKRNVATLKAALNTVGSLFKMGER